MFTVILAGAAPALRADDAKVEGDLKKMQGTWVRAGDEGPDLKWVIEGDNLKASVNGQDYTCKLKLDAKATPHPSADLAIKDGPGDSAGKTSKGIYKFEGDRLVFCVTMPGGETRPTEFKNVEEERFVFTLKKE
jgi:uncharacterized protein (TIGR03067 family)